ncbi:methionyl-tRNA formyltransferase [Gillisia limnaea]|uniref:Methionyl-tRNA formyltransferase n=1 Tax=Gillisia limnaea (strain DSM 15749 / LMG 21470 / R-8282) TaxID=865937 RepID=H2BWW7_GILLR|nr:methionyl-tRNA formyltransferase [Gillisia limnaea]EHQ04140.1 methionyl-tRNA formyltransferase [Gillisia limnaea DSM 15749]
MKNLRIVFMGTPEFAVSTLKEIIKAGFNVLGVVTAPDKPSGRGRKLQESAVKQYAVAHGLHVLQPVNLKSSEFIEEIKALNPNIQVVVAFRMLPKVVWQLPDYGTFNLHASLLPQYRGAAPINWAIINGETVTGVSTFFIDEKIDTGAMILQREVEIKADESVGELHDKLMQTGAELVVETLELIQNNKVIPTKQNLELALNEAPKLTKENTRINWNVSIEQVYNFIRGLNPYPAAWTNLKNDREQVQMKIYQAEISKEIHKFSIGELLLVEKQLKVAVKDGFVILMEIQLPGKRKMLTKELLNGYYFETDAKVL